MAVRIMASVLPTRGEAVEADAVEQHEPEELHVAQVAAPVAPGSVVMR